MFLVCYRVVRHTREIKFPLISINPLNKAYNRNFNPVTQGVTVDLNSHHSPCNNSLYGYFRYNENYYNNSYVLQGVLQPYVTGLCTSSLTTFKLVINILLGPFSAT